MEEVEAATYAHGSKICLNVTSSKTSSSHRYQQNRNGLEVVKALAKGSFTDVAQDMLNIQKAKLTRDYLHTSAIIVGDGQVFSAVNDVNDYAVRQQVIACKANAGKRLKTSLAH